MSNKTSSSSRLQKQKMYRSFPRLVVKFNAVLKETIDNGFAVDEEFANPVSAMRLKSFIAHCMVLYKQDHEKNNKDDDDDDDDANHDNANSADGMSALMLTSCSFDLIKEERGLVKDNIKLLHLKRRGRLMPKMDNDDIPIEGQTLDLPETALFALNLAYGAAGSKADILDEFVRPEQPNEFAPKVRKKRGDDVVMIPIDHLNKRVDEQFIALLCMYSPDPEVREAALDDKPGTICEVEKCNQRVFVGKTCILHSRAVIDRLNAKK